VPLLSTIISYNPKNSKDKGFTIVELLIVIVVIAILAAITIVSYNGITLRAKESAAQTGAKEGFTKIATFAIDHGDLYPDTLSIAGLPADGPTDYQYTVDNASTPRSFCLTASVSGISYQVSSTNSAPTKGACAGHTEGGSDPNARVAMQVFSQAHCDSLEIYTGANANALVSLSDNRGGTARTYQVGRLADNRCWMLTNLRLGSTTGSITLTSSDSDVADSFVLPKVEAPGAADYDIPQAMQIPGDSGAGETDYGYLYNWSAATAGETRASVPVGADEATHSICAKGWRLPSGGETGVGDFGMLDKAYSGSGTHGTGGPTLSLWSPSGAFRLAYSGMSWSPPFSKQTEGAWLWSRTAHPETAYMAYVASRESTEVYPGDNASSRSLGFAVRCVLGAPH